MPLHADLLRIILTSFEMASKPLPGLEQLNKASSESDGQQQRTFSDLRPWQGFREGVQAMLQGLDRVDRKWKVWSMAPLTLLTLSVTQ